MLDLYVTGSIYVTAGLAASMQSLGYSTAVYKPVDNNSGFESFINGVDNYIKTYTTYELDGSSTPLLSAAAQKITLEPNEILKKYQKIQMYNECVFVQGIAGLGTPLNKNFLEEDLIKLLNIPLLMVVDVIYSPINNILISINHAKEVGIDLRGIILSGYTENMANPDIKLMPKLIEEYTGVKILGLLPEFESQISPTDLISSIFSGVDLEAVFKLRIAKLNL